MSHDYLFKILILGNSDVGKSSISVRYIDNEFSNSPIITMGSDFKAKNVKIDDKIIRCQIWDSGGQERFHTITSSYYRGAHGIIIVYDIIDNKSFTAVNQWLQEINLYANENVCKMVLGNKCDLSDCAIGRAVKFDEGKKFADNHKMSFFEVSAKDGTNIDQAFLKILSDIKSIYPEPEIIKPEENITIPINKSAKKNRKCFC